jgi:hypothetical protein
MKIAALAIAVSVALAGIAVPTHAASCSTPWGSLPKTAADASAYDTLVNVRTGQNECYDRMVLDVSNSLTGYNVRYVSNVYAEGSGQLIPLTGGAKLQIVSAQSYSPTTGMPTYAGITGNTLPGVNLTGYQTFRSAKFAGSFEGQSTIGLGVRAQLPFRVMKLDNRVVIDVAHKW